MTHRLALVGAVNRNGCQLPGAALPLQTLSMMIKGKGLQQMETCCLGQCLRQIAEGPIDIALGLFSTYLLRPQGIH